MVIKHQNNHIIHEITFTSVRCNNVMWVGASDAVLFDSVQDGKVQGLRPEVLTPLIHMYLNPPRYSTKQKNHDILRIYCGGEGEFVAIFYHKLQVLVKCSSWKAT